MATTSKITGFSVCCPECNDAEAAITIELNNLGLCRCSECDSTFTPADAIRKLTGQLREWQKIDRWIEVGAVIAAE